MAFDRPVDGIETATAPAALAADARTAFETAFHRGLAQMFTPPPPDFHSTLALSLPPAHTGRPGLNPSPFLFASLRARPKPSASSRDAFRGPSHLPHSTGTAFTHATPYAGARHAAIG